MARVYHGRMELHWCSSCRSPLVQGGPCPSCGSVPTTVPHTPPGDIRPAFGRDLEEIMSAADSQWGPGAGECLIVPDEPVLLNPCPSPDRLDEIIIRGQVIGSIAFNLERMRTSLILRESGGRALSMNGFRPEKGSVVIDDSVIAFLLDGKNLLCPGIVDADRNIKEGDEVLVLDERGAIIACGNARKNGKDLVNTHGMGVKVRWAMEPVPVHGDRGPADLPRRTTREEWSGTWSRVVEVNGTYINKKAERSIEFIGRQVKNNRLPPAVSYSGGKDSLATLYLVLEAGLKPPVMFIDTGLEFPETVEHVHSLVRELGLELLEGRPVSGFFENLEKFGPPGRDFRWCCKLCKLGPTTRLIEENFPEGVLSFIGQRRFESDKRQQKGSVWRNPWVPKQLGASPVQNWTALDIWLYIFSRKAPYNVLYEMGYPRIGCWLCPSCDMAEMELARETRVDRSEWEDFLEMERKEAGLPPEWIDMGYHRFKELPPHMVRLANESGLDPALMARRKPRGSEGSILEMVAGTNTCDDGISREGLLGKDVPWEHFATLLNILGSVEADGVTGGIFVTPNDWKMKRKALEVFPDGTLVIRGPDQKALKKFQTDLVSVIKRAVGCIGCSICAGRCPADALKVDREEGRVRLDPALCKHCSACLGPCPAEAFVDDPFVV
ncbi:MAG: phosphoadenosine phosphosulfate reductase family protein [Thermoplasmatota archaeon]